MQVAEWVARILAAGDAFAGPGASGSLRALLAVQASGARSKAPHPHMYPCQHPNMRRA